MNPDKLLDAIGMVDDRFFITENNRRHFPVRKAITGLIAAILVFALSVGTVMAVSPQFREFIFSIFYIETPELPPASKTEPTQDNTEPTKSGLQEIDIVNIDGVVHARYFTSDGLVLTCDGGFYTSSHTNGDTPPADGAFWEIGTEGIANVGATRVDFPLTHKNRTIPIIFDYGILNGKLNIQVWPQGLNENPVLNGWNIEPIGERTDIVLMTIPVDTGTDCTHDLLLLNLDTMEVTDLLVFSQHQNMVVDACRLSDDLQYAIAMGVDKSTGMNEYWLCDLQKDCMTTLTALTGATVTNPYFLNETTIAFQDYLGDGFVNIVRYHIPTGVQDVVIENTMRRVGRGSGYRDIQKSGGGGTHGLVYHEDGTVTLVNLLDGTKLDIAGLDTARMSTSESPDGTRIMVAYEETNENNELGYGFSQLGILNPETGVLQMLTRNIGGNPENFRGWLDNNTLVITAQDFDGGFYVYMYQFSE